MAAVVASFATSKTEEAATLAVNMPAGVQSGDLLIVVLGWGSGDGGWTSATATGWTSLDNTNNGSTVGGQVFYRIADGTEGATQTFTASALDDEVAAVALRVTTYNGNPESALGATGSSANPDAPSLTPSGGSQEYLWLVGFAIDAGRTVDTDPANYTEVAEVANVGANVTTYVGQRTLTASVEDPGAATISASDTWVAWTLAVAPAAAAGVTANVVQTLSGVTQAAVGTLEPLGNAVQTLSGVQQVASATANAVLADVVQSLSQVVQAAVAEAARVGNVVQILPRVQQLAIEEGQVAGSSAPYQTVLRRRRVR